MDPTANLAALREALSLAAQLPHDSEARNEALEDVAQYVEALDEWLTRGGFLPAQWRRDCK